MGLSTSHISPLGKDEEKGAAYDYTYHSVLLTEGDKDFVAFDEARIHRLATLAEVKQERRSLILRLGGSLARVKVGFGGGGGGGGDRGDVLGFSSASRRRLMRTIASMERAERPVFVTMTYPDVFSDSMDVWKRDIDTFGKRLARKFPEGGFVWRIEFKVRKTGISAGKLAPHFHLLVYGARFNRLLKWVSRAWWRVVGSGDGNHLLAGTRVELIYSQGGIMRYVGKYVAKVATYPEGWRGRAWGIVGRKNLPWAVEVIISLTEGEAVKMVRLGRKMIGARGRTFPSGITWIVNAERVLDYLEFLCGYYNGNGAT